MRHLVRLGAIMLVMVSPWESPAENSLLPLVMANDNRTAAGHLKNGALELRLELRQGCWYPEDEKGQCRDVYAFAEAGHAPQSSGPLIRVVLGTEIHATVHNTLPVAAKVYGLHRHPGDTKDALKLAPGETREEQFLAGEPGTYFYWATTSDKPLEGRNDAETMLSGALIVDAPGTKPDDRILVLGLWSRGTTAKDFEEILSVNGKTWPYTERLTYRLGETSHWRVINPTPSDHGMHLHGFFFKVDGVGDGERYELYPEEQRRLAVTEHIESGHVFEMTWTPERAGNWLFHCHMLGHMSPSKSPAADSSSSTPDHSMGMGGLVMGITVLPAATAVPAPAAEAAARKLQLVISDNPAKVPLYNLELNDPLKPAESDKKKLPSLLGPPIVLTRGEATEIEVKNQSSNPTAIHWHGIELESYYDGVPGWTGSGQQTTPPVAPGTSFVAHMTPPRAGTFIYHTHWHDDAQLRNGIYGPLIVLEPGQKYDPEHDRTFVFSVGNYAPFGFMLLVNGTPQQAGTINLHTSTAYRLRLINITSNSADLRVRLANNGVPLQWKVVAKDGADLPPAQLKLSPAEMGITVGETYDVEYESGTAGLAELEVWDPVNYPPVTLQLRFADTK